MIDSLVYAALTDPNLASLLQNDDGTWRVYPSGSLGAAGIPADPSYPYVMHGDGGSNSVAAVRGTRRVLTIAWDVYAYDRPGSFIRIKNLLEIAKDNVEGKEGQVTPGGWRATEIIHTSNSADGFDPIRQQVTKRSTFRVVTSRAL